MFADDCYCIEPCPICDSAFFDTKGCDALLGLELDGGNESHPSATIRLLGATIELTVGSVEATIPPSRMEHLSAGLKHLLLDNALTPSGAAKWRGRLGFAQSLMFGRAVRALIRPFSARQYAQWSPRQWALPDDLEEVIPWWVALVRPAPSKGVHKRPNTGGCLYRCVRRRTWGMRGIPRWNTPHGSYPPTGLDTAPVPGISEYEICANISGLAVANELAPGRAIFLFCDNMGVVGEGVRGACRTRLGRTLVSVFWAIADALATAVWVEYVASALNCPDAPSRRFSKISEELRTHVSETNGGAHPPPLD